MAASLRRLFIANRGEIARRIATTARRLGIESVVVSDRAAPPAYLLGCVSHFVPVDAESPALFLDAARMTQLAKDAGCDSVHPGFGFLSENAGFARQVAAGGLIWVGPNPEAIQSMASKGTARTAAEAAGVPCIRGLNDFPVPSTETGDWSILEEFADRVGYPLLLKAAYGGGGKGMRLVRSSAELRDAALRARSEAASAFGDGSLICEQYLTAPRHVEVQILADKHGQIVAIGDRDCSLQRRHQKIIEEAPAPALTPATRAALHRAAVSLARGVGYDSTGTVEFLLDWSEAGRGSDPQRFYFLEMNTRLQVEHPVTEEVFGIDLVEWQLRVARGERLPASFATLQPRGHSLEARLYAEDVRRDFFPAPGTVAAFLPADGPGIRWERGMDAADVVTDRFDPMIAKLVASGGDRATAMARLRDALERSVIAGPPNNLDLLIELTRSADFVGEPVTTHYLRDGLAPLVSAIDRRYAAGQPLADELLALVETNALGGRSLATTSVDVASLTELAFSLADHGYGDSTSPQSRPAIAGGQAAVGFAASWQSAADARQQARLGAGLHRALDGKQTGFWYAALKAGASRKFWVSFEGLTFARELARAATGGAAAAAVNQEIVAPVPGKVIAVKVNAGDLVQTGTPVFVLESMKMEFEVKAARTGCIRTVEVRIGEQVTAGRLLASWSDDG